MTVKKFLFTFGQLGVLLCEVEFPELVEFMETVKEQEVT